MNPARCEARVSGAGARALPIDLQPSVYSPFTLLRARRPERQASPAATREMALAAAVVAASAVAASAVAASVATAAASRVRGGSVAKVARRRTTPLGQSPLGGVPLSCDGGGGLPILRRRDCAGQVVASTEVEVKVKASVAKLETVRARRTARPDAQPWAAATDCSWWQTGRTREISSARLALGGPSRVVTSRDASTGCRRART